MQSYSHLHVLADRVTAMALDMSRDSVRIVDDSSARGLLHAGFASPTVLSGPFVTVWAKGMQGAPGVTNLCVDAFRGPLDLASQVLVRTISEGSTFAMKAR